MRTTKEDVEDASGKGERECCFGEGGCLESSEMESGIWRNCCKSGVTVATPIYGYKPGSKLDDDDKQNVCDSIPSNFISLQNFIFFQP